MPPEQQPAVSQPAAEGRPYAVVPAESLLTIAVFRGGALASRGHNHVIASHDIKGTVYVHSQIDQSSFELIVPVASLTVDESDLRSQEGAEFPPAVPQSAKDGTRQNMLGPAVLDAEHYPDIRLVSERLQVNPDGMLAQVQVRLRDQLRSIPVPLKYEIADDIVRARGELTLKQTDLGLTPFAVFGGMLAVQDEMKLRFRIVARATMP